MLKEDGRNRELFRKLKQLADGRLCCDCGNADWKHFLFLEWGKDVLATCKVCGSSYKHAGGTWPLEAKGIDRKSQGQATD